MSVSSLSKFTVPLDTDQSASAQGLLMPKLAYSFRASFENFGISSPRTELSKQIMDFTRPSLTFEEIPIDIYNSKVFIQGKHTWEALTCTFRDDVNGNVAKLMGEQVQKQFDMMEQSRAAAGIDYKFITRFEVLDGGNGQYTPAVLETWEFYGCFLTNVKYSDANYGTSEPMTVAATIKFDNAVNSPLGTGVGTSVGRLLGQTATG